MIDGPHGDLIERFLRERPLGFSDTMLTSPVEHLREFAVWMRLGPEKTRTPSERISNNLARMLGRDSGIPLSKSGMALADEAHVVRLVAEGNYGEALRIVQNCCHDTPLALNLCTYLQGVIDGHDVASPPKEEPKS